MSGRDGVGNAGPEDFAALREVETEWLIDNLSESIANLSYPVGCGDSPTYEHLKFAAERLFDRYAKMIEMARNAGALAQASPETDPTGLEEIIADLRREKLDLREALEFVRDWLAKPPSAYSLAALDIVFKKLRKRVGDTLSLSSTSRPSPHKSWTPTEWWEYVGGLAGEFKRDQMRDMLAERGLAISSTNCESPTASSPDGSTPSQRPHE